MDEPEVVLLVQKYFEAQGFKLKGQPAEGDIVLNGGELSKQEAGQTSELSKQEAGQTSQLSKQEAGQELEAAERGYEFETELEVIKQAGATARAEIEANTALATLASEEMTSLTAALTDLATQYAKSVQDAYDQTSWTTSYRDNYLKQLKDQYKSDKEELYNIYSS